MALPTLMLVVARRWPHLLSRRNESEPVDDSSGEP
jgi:hypothetical protein